MEEKYLMEKLREIRRMETYIWNTGHRMARRWLDREELYKGDPHLLMQVSRKEGCAQNELARRLFVTPATLTVMLNRMEKAGLVARRQDAQDVRRNQLELTAAGEAKVMAVREKMDALDAQMFLGVTDQEAMAFLKTCETMFDNLADESTRTLTICKLHRAARVALVANKEDD